MAKRSRRKRLKLKHQPLVCCGTNRFRWQCPVCGSHFVHQCGVAVHQNEIKTVIVDGLVVTAEGCDADDGTNIDLHMWCERSHAWTVRTLDRNGLSMVIATDVRHCQERPGLLWRPAD